MTEDPEYRRTDRRERGGTEDEEEDEEEEDLDREWEFCDGGRLEREMNPNKKKRENRLKNNVNHPPCALSPRN